MVDGRGVSDRSNFKLRKQAGLMDSMKHLFTITKTVINHNSFNNLFSQHFLSVYINLHLYFSVLGTMMISLCCNPGVEQYLKIQ
jgi:hypothetical protein